MNTEIKFEWDEDKDFLNQEKHNVSFHEARKAFEDSNRLIFEDEEHTSLEETRFFCVGKIENKIMTVRFTYRENRIRIFGAGYWRKYRKLYLSQR